MGVEKTRAFSIPMIGRKRLFYMVCSIENTICLGNHSHSMVEGGFDEMS